ncbi:hypothetical protein ACL02T_24930 [Pseudonocardia sp. RS010]|uniref:hypothetical protein n=1 Tax=Pseudonocardia sp. RS010 TaxID=3385979 RepID=UPI0039A24A5A
MDGSGWQQVSDLLTQVSHTVAVVQNPTLSLEGDAEATRRIIDTSCPASPPPGQVTIARNDHPARTRRA